jgi:Trk K+ transport system NAD-binding subunit
MFLKLKGIKSNIIIDTKDNLYDNLFKQAWADVVINTEEISSLLLTRSLTDKANVLIRELLDNREAYEIYLDELDSNKYLWKTLKELKIDFMDKNINIVSIYRNWKVIHDNSEILLKNDSVYYFSENRLDIK